LKSLKKILLITGAYPPNHCGVGDYTAKFYEYLKKEDNLTVGLFYKSDWSLKCYFKYLKQLFSTKSDVYHFQYPTEGYGYSMLPLLLLVSLFRKKTVLTVHELSSRNILAYVYTQLLMFFSNRVIVSNSFEQNHARRLAFKSEKVSVIPIASNIQKSNFVEIDFKEREVDLAYFGHIRPIKGIENFIHTVSLLDRNYRVQLIGQALEKYIVFFEEIKIKAELMNVEMIVDKDENDVADLLSNVKIVYLPFPDGVSNRRGTLLASIQNGCVVVSKKSCIQDFNVFFENYVYLIDSDEEAVDVIQKLLRGELLPKELSQIKNVFSWNNVVSEYLRVYDKCE
jgi:glycosyltransferase involved in cell wall biosynthesis